MGFYDWVTGPLLPIGTEAPGFTLTDYTGQPVRLHDLSGRAVVLIFYPGNDTTICTRQLCAVRDNWSAFERCGAAVFGVNGAGAPSHRAFAGKYAFPFRLLADRGWQVSRLYHAGWGVIRRTVYVVGPAGRIVYAKRGNPSTAEILAAVEDARAITS